MPDRAAVALSDRNGNDGMRDHAAGERRSMVRVLHEEPAFSEMFVSHLLARTIRVEADLVDQLFNSSEKRLARALLLLANFGKDGRPEPIIAKVSQETLAEMIGTTRSRVSFFMNKFRKLGLIDLQRPNRNPHLIAECRFARGTAHQQLSKAKSCLYRKLYPHSGCPRCR